MGSRGCIFQFLFFLILIPKQINKNQFAHFKIVSFFHSIFESPIGAGRVKAIDFYDQALVFFTS